MDITLIGGMDRLKNADCEKEGIPIEMLHSCGVFSLKEFLRQRSEKKFFSDN